jgi:N6-adenosine-specific RNA methylase IME4
LKACKLLRWQNVPVRVVDLKRIIDGEHAENAHRKDFLPSEVKAIRRAMLPAERAKAKERHGGDHRGNPGKFPALGQARDRIGAFAGLSGRTVEKIAEVVDAAEREPKRFRPLVDEMDRTGKVDGAYRKLKQALDADRVQSLSPVNGRFRTLVIDPPWHYEQNIAGRIHKRYASMSFDELKNLPVSDWAEDDAHLYLWTTNLMIGEACNLLPHWGFRLATVLTWIKPRMVLGVYFRNSTEHCLFALKGSLDLRTHDIPTHFHARTGAHSEKPEEFYEIVRRARFPPYGEAFQGKARDRFANLFA